MHGRRSPSKARSREDRIMTFEASQNLSEQIAQYLGNKIIQFEMKPGERILEARLAEELGVSRSPLREALRILEKQRLVELIPRRGARVTELTREYIENLSDVLKEILGLVAYRGVEKGTPHDLDNLYSALREMESCARRKDIPAYQDATFTFAIYSCRGTKNHLLEELVLFLWPDVRRIQFAALSFQKDTLLDNLRFYRSACEYFAAGDAEGASQVIRELVEHETSYSLRILSEGFPTR